LAQLQFMMNAKPELTWPFLTAAAVRPCWRQTLGAVIRINYYINRLSTRWTAL